ncbi:ABC transporter ATP-binding protein [Sulfobacillus harzensis]|uniref:ABC transporter ATP-binding protein n=1 Tax=Sulfobacillus harzensis TaxID=2729629 RepID=A0A7Y0L259_9FIRM|nr:ABC transporter ATP-binding protein [Sulfobacillus harzensis]NMP21341.1 ABC transporter ATP-binding protein [Sulfobacillus harzensis]
MNHAQVLELDQVGFHWSGSHRGLGPISASIREGTLVGLIGPNGAGKSTLLRLIGAFWTKDAGAIRILGQDVTALSASERAQRIAFVPQSLETQFDLTVREVVELGRLSQRSWRDRWAFKGGLAANKLEEILAATELYDLKDRPFNTLSGGEARRVLLASALAQEAPLLLLDEPTAHLDPGHAVKFLNLVREMIQKQHITVLMAYHDLATVGLYADVLWVMNHGQLILEGSPDAVLTDPRIPEIYDANLISMLHPRNDRPMLIFP